MHYYDVGLGSKMKWNTSVFTYFADEELLKSTIVKVPFWSRNKTGVILNKVLKPKCKTKPLSLPYNTVIAKETIDFINWYQDYYASQGGQAFAQLLPAYLTKPKPLETKSIKYNKSKVVLTTEQQRAKKDISNTDKPTVLHGITGSGKTRIYISLILDQLKKGKNCLLL